MASEKELFVTKQYVPMGEPIVKNENTIVSSLITKEEAQRSELDELMEKKFESSLPAFIAAFAKRQALSDAQIEQIRQIIDQ